jgi:hypothetical protein
VRRGISTSISTIPRTVLATSSRLSGTLKAIKGEENQWEEDLQEFSDMEEALDGGGAVLLRAQVDLWSPVVECKV